MSNKFIPSTPQAREYQETKEKYSTKFVRYRDGAAIYSMSQSSFERLAKEARAVYKVGKMALVNVEILEAYLEKFRV